MKCVKCGKEHGMGVEEIGKFTHIDVCRDCLFERCYVAEVREQVKMSEWINVNDGLPESHDYVLVAINSQGTGEPKPINIARRIGYVWEFLGLIDGAYMDISYPMDPEDITHWMPLPAPPLK